MLCQIYFCGNIGDSHPQAYGIGLQMEFAAPFLHFGNNRFYNSRCVGHNFDGFNYWLYLNGIRHDYRHLYGWQLFLVGYEYRTRISHLLEEEIVHLLPYLTTVQCSQFYDTVVDMRIRVMIVHQSGFFLQDGNYFILTDKSRILNLRFEIIPRDIAVIIGNKAVGNIHLTADELFKCRETALCQLTVELITAFGRSCSAEGYFNDVDCTVLAYSS